jgi:hypothetical protein
LNVFAVGDFVDPASVAIVCRILDVLDSRFHLKLPIPY